MVLIVLVGVTYGFMKPVVDDAINKRIPSKRRATINSAKEMLQNLTFIFSAPFMGQLVESEGPFMSMMLLAFILLVLGVFVYYLLKKHKVV